MKLTILLITLLCSISYSYNMDSLYNDKIKNHKHLEQCSYQNNVRHGVCKLYLNNQLMYETEFDMGKTHGNSVWYSNDNIIRKSKYINDLLHDTTFIYNRIDKNIQIVIYNKNKLIQSALIEPNGVITTFYNIFGYNIHSKRLNDSITEEYTYNPNGTLDNKIMYLHGNRHGSSEWYYENGGLKYVTTYDNGIKHGITINYDYDSKIYSIRKHNKNKFKWSLVINDKGKQHLYRLIDGKCQGNFVHMRMDYHINTLINYIENNRNITIYDRVYYGLQNDNYCADGVNLNMGTY